MVNCSYGVDVQHNESLTLWPVQVILRPLEVKFCQDCCSTPNSHSLLIWYGRKMWWCRCTTWSNIDAMTFSRSSYDLYSSNLVCPTAHQSPIIRLFILNIEGRCDGVDMQQDETFTLWPFKVKPCLAYCSVPNSHRLFILNGNEGVMVFNMIKVWPYDFSVILWPLVVKSCPGCYSAPNSHKLIFFDRVGRWDGVDVHNDPILTQWPFKVILWLLHFKSCLGCYSATNFHSLFTLMV